MKYYLPLIIIFSISLLKSTGQNQKPDIVRQEWGTFKGVPINIDQNEFRKWKSQSIEGGALWGSYNGIKGNVFYNEKWNKGYILLQDNRIEKDVPINFNIYTNEIYFLLDSQILVLDHLIKVSEFGMKDEKSELVQTNVFRCGYPAIDNNSSKSFYNIIVNNKIALLRHYDKRIMGVTDSYGAPEQKFVDSESWYIYNAPENKIIPIKKNKKSLLDALPQYATYIESIIGGKKLKLKTEDDWVILFNELNGVLK